MADVDFAYDGDVVIVTGASSGIGRQIALAFGAAGATVINADITPETIDTDAEHPTHDAIEAAGGVAHYVETDASDPSSIRDVIETAREFGGVDVMVNNAGTANTDSIFDCTPEGFDPLVHLNVYGVLFGCKYAAEDMLDRDDPGTIVNTASIRSEFAHWDQIQYGTTKGAVRMITRYAAFELAEHGIRVNAVGPGPIATHGRASATADDLRAQIERGDYTKPIPLGRAGEPEEIAPTVLFLASDAASYITGELVFIDGGYHTY